jgi:hypothetical protein
MASVALIKIIHYNYTKIARGAEKNNNFRDSTVGKTWIHNSKHTSVRGIQHLTF